jgi:hypothetical protein
MVTTMSVRFYTRSSPTRGYSTGPILELVRLAWPWLVVALFVSAIIGTFEGRLDSLVILLSMAGGAWASWAWKRR